MPLQDPFIQITTNRPDLVSFNAYPFERDDFPEYKPSDEPPYTPPQTAEEPLRLMVVFQAYNAWFFFVNGKGENPVFDNYEDAAAANRHAWNVLHGNVNPSGSHPRKTVRTPGFQQCTIINVPMIH
jgi:hypothetical protein